MLEGLPRLGRRAAEGELMRERHGAGRRRLDEGAQGRLLETPRRLDRLEEVRPIGQLASLTLGNPVEDLGPQAREQ